MCAGDLVPIAVASHSMKQNRFFPGKLWINVTVSVYTLSLIILPVHKYRTKRYKCSNTEWNVTDYRGSNEYC